MFQLDNNTILGELKNAQILHSWNNFATTILFIIKNVPIYIKEFWDYTDNAAKYANIIHSVQIM